MSRQGTRDEQRGGKVREEQDWIRGGASNPSGAEFIPPPPDLVPGLLADLCAFCNRLDLPAAIQAAIAHVQFETIHPFFDGNGSVGRAGDADRYVAGLGSWRRGEEEDWYSVGLFDLLDRFERDLEPSGPTPKPTRTPPG